MTIATTDRPATTLTVRRPNIDFTDTPKYWVLGDPQATHALNILHFGIPAGERYFIDSIRLAMPYIKDKTLLADARSFIGQEALHARLHERAADHLGLSEIPLIKARVVMADRTRERLYRRVDHLPEPARKRAVLTWLSTTMLGEHFTALFADILFDRTKSDWDAIDPQMQQLLSWHAAEEMEHRTLPYDIYQHIGGGYVTRVLPLVPTIGLLPLALIGVTDLMLRLDPDHRGGFSLRSYVRSVRGKRTPNIVDVAAKLPVYFLPNYHPSKLGNDERPRAYLASNPPALAGSAASTGAARAKRRTARDATSN
jgi:predicted metal-dependent hydrolase